MACKIHNNFILDQSQQELYIEKISGIGHIKPRPANRYTVLPPGEFNGDTPEPFPA